MPVSEKLEPRPRRQRPPSVPSAVAEEQQLLDSVLAHLEQRTNEQRHFEDFDAGLVSLRDEIADAKPEDVAPLVEQMYRMQALAHQVGRGAAAAVDRGSPYFGHLRLERDARSRDVLIGKQTYLDAASGVAIVDWRNAPVSRVFYQYGEGEDYEEEFAGKRNAGRVLLRRTVTVTGGELRRVSTAEGTFVRGREGAWHDVGDGALHLSGGAGAAFRPDRERSGRLGVASDGAHRVDKHLPEIVALIDKEQFDLITRPESGVVVVHGVAGSGKTTVGLHRMAYLAFQQPRRFRPQSMCAVVFSRALKDYISRVLPALGVEGVRVVTYGGWARDLRLRLMPDLPTGVAEDTPAVVTRLKKHPAMLAILDEAVGRLSRELGTALSEAFVGEPDESLVAAAWEAMRSLVPAERVALLDDWCQRRRQIAGVKRKNLSQRGAVLLANVLPDLTVRAEDVVSVWEDILTDLSLLTESFARHAPGAFSEKELTRAHRWSVRQLSQRTAEVDSEEEAIEAELDAEDDTLLLRLYQKQIGLLRAARQRPIKLSHLFVDEVQDLSPVELAVLLGVVDSRRSVTLAGDPAQRMVTDNGFESWEQVLELLDLRGLAIEPLRVAYRSTAEIMNFARHVLGPLCDPRDRFETTRRGVPVELLSFGDHGEAVSFLAEELRRLQSEERTASVAVIARSPSAADMYYEGLSRALVPHLRRVRNQDFSFAPGIEVTDVFQVKGLEFDYAVLLECTAERYPDTAESRYLLHIAATRAAHQLWLIATGNPSPLLPEDMLEVR